MKALPNIMTGARLVLTLLVFLALIALIVPAVFEWSAASGLAPRAVQKTLYLFAFWGFLVAAVTDFLDGWLARRFDATTTLGAILDPIADKVLVAGMIVAISATGHWVVALAGGLILFREFSVSAMRETLAPKGLKLPVTLLAKWKTTLQLVALAAQLFLFGWDQIWNLPPDPELFQRAATAAHILLGLATVVTVWTGVEYALSARKALAMASADGR
ncbi:MAG TPA: CDP-diacylglycerol--glycerol-3-phosphate 3-phosphatidyltransferase [Caulobacter sp.]|nr:CDP-diacylglycerol--glycerol-3-phosphate 3-phosphatidyltransferase [Caulobacter sp.]